jgi:hypothetical protein
MKKKTTFWSKAGTALGKASDTARKGMDKVGDFYDKKYERQNTSRRKTSSSSATGNFKIYNKSLDRTPSGRYRPAVRAGRASSRFEQYDNKSYKTLAAAKNALNRYRKEFKGSSFLGDKEIFQIRSGSRVLYTVTDIRKKKSATKRKTSTATKRKPMSKRKPCPRGMKKKTSTKRKAPTRRKATKPARRGGFTGEGFGDPLGTVKFRGFM